jgi:hypothetical protein
MINKINKQGAKNKGCKRAKLYYDLITEELEIISDMYFNWD